MTVTFNFKASIIAKRGRHLLVDVALSTAAFCVVTVLPALPALQSAGRATWEGLISHVALYAAIAAAALIATRTYRTIWRYVSFRDVIALLQASFFTVIGFAVIDLLLINPNLPISRVLLFWSLALIWALNVGFLVTPRFLVRILSEVHFFDRFAEPEPHGESVAALIVGDVERIEAFMRESGRSRHTKYKIVGVLTDDIRVHDSYLHGKQVLGKLEDLAAIIRRLKLRGIRPHTLILARDRPSKRDFEMLLEIASSTGLRIGQLPPLGTIRDAATVKPIELADLLGRSEVPIDAAAVAGMITGRRVLVTGAGGSIGSELCRQISRHKPAQLVIGDFGEYNLYAIDKELSETYPDIERLTALFDVRDADTVSYWIERTRPEIVFHAAALKHVPLLEDHPTEGVKTNILGTINVAEACRKHGVAAMVTISTDKAVNPCNVMGATKRLAEAYCQGLDQLSPDGTRFITVRFGNVLGSAGSVVPLFQRQIEAGGPITVTHPDIKRYFMTIPEAVTLVLEAGAQGVRRDGERGDIYVLDMGQPIKILDLANQMIRLSGWRPDVDIAIKFVGLRPGEKLFEEVVHGDESVKSTNSKSILRIAPRMTDLAIVRQQIQEFRQACASRDEERVYRLLKIAVPEFRLAPPNEDLTVRSPASTIS